ncbi:MAG: hypothetical protein IJP42_03300 [Selenomonadaceae bacterium]|nr:hypothetical protein [Selenomonadaceae bacterium]
MRLHKVTNALVIDLDKLSGLRLENLEYPDRFRVYLLVDGHEYFAATFSDREKRKNFVDKLIEVWGDDESGANDSPAAVD